MNVIEEIREAIAANNCSHCRVPVVGTFKTPEEVAEYKSSGLCRACQAHFLGDDDPDVSACPEFSDDTCALCFNDCRNCQIKES